MTDHIDLDDEHRKLLYALNRADLSLAEYAARDAALSALVAVVRTRLAVEAAERRCDACDAEHDSLLGKECGLIDEQPSDRYLQACDAQIAAWNDRVEAGRAADAAMQPFRPVAPSAPGDQP